MPFQWLRAAAREQKQKQTKKKHDRSSKSLMLILIFLQKEKIKGQFVREAQWPTQKILLSMETPSMFIWVNNVSLNNFELSIELLSCSIPNSSIACQIWYDKNREDKQSGEKQFKELCWCYVGIWEYVVVYLLTCLLLYLRS